MVQSSHPAHTVYLAAARSILMLSSHLFQCFSSPPTFWPKLHVHLSVCSAAPHAVPILSSAVVCPFITFCAVRPFGCEMTQETALWGFWQKCPSYLHWPYALLITNFITLASDVSAQYSVSACRTEILTALQLYVAGTFFKTSVPMYQTVRRHITETRLLNVSLLYGALSSTKLKPAPCTQFNKAAACTLHPV